MWRSRRGIKVEADRSRRSRLHSARAVSQIVWSGWGRQLWRQAGFSAGAGRVVARPPRKGGCRQIGGPQLAYKSSEAVKPRRIFDEDFPADLRENPRRKSG